MRNQKGVTLYEVISCLAIIGVLSGIALPTYQALILRYRFATELSRVVALLKLAKSYATTRNAPVVFVYESDGYRAFVDDGKEGGVAGDWKRQAGEKILAECNVRDRGLQISIAESTFSAQRTRFLGNPGIKAGTLVLLSEGGAKAKITINVIGRIRVERI